MKHLMIAIVLMFSMVAQAEEVPSYLKDGVITVTLKNGKTYTYSANEYKVVKRGAKKAAPILAAAPSESQAPKSSEPVRESSHKNRISVLVGHGLTGKMNISSGPSTVDVQQDRDVIGGVMLQRDLTKDYHLMGGALTNKTFLLGVGVGF